MKKKKSGSGSSLIFVLVGPLADEKTLARFAHDEFRSSAAVAFIGVDGGLKALLASGLPITLAIGDFDSAPSIQRLVKGTGISLIHLAREKERSDLSFALEFAADQNATVIYALGFQGGRADHDFAVHLDLVAASQRVPRVVSVGEKGVVFYLSARHSPLRIESKNIESLRVAMAPKNRHSRDVVKWASVFPIGGRATGVRLHGLRFKAAGGILSVSSQGLSNEVRAREIEVGVRQGRVALFFPA